MKIDNTTVKVQTITIRLDTDEERNALAGLMMNAVAWHASGVLGKMCCDIYGAINEGGPTTEEWKPLVKYANPDSRIWRAPSR